MRESMLPVYAPVLKEPFSVVEAMTVARVASVPYAKPRMVGPAPPVAVMFPFNVTVVVVMEEAEDVVRVGEVFAVVVNV